MYRKFLISILLLFSILLASCTQSHEPITVNFKAMDTSARIEVFETGEEYTEYFESRLSELDRKFDPENADGEIAILNNTRSDSHLSDETRNLLLECIKLSEKTDERFDITLYPITKLWGFEGSEPKKPQDILVSLLVTKSGMDTVRYSDGTFSLEKYTMLDPSAVTKGYASDLISAELSDMGCDAALFNVGEHFRTLGIRPDGKNWTIPLSDPFERSSQFATLEVSGSTSVSAKGAYQRYFEEDGKRYCNILDPKSGNPVDNDLISVIVVCASGIKAEAFATACFVAGSKDAEAFYKSSDDFEMILVLKEGQIRVTEGLADALTLADSKTQIKVINK